MNVLKIRNLTIGEGIPKICVPIVGETEETILESALQITKSEADFVEWRVDCYKDFENSDKVKTVLIKLREILGDSALLFTFRTTREGGKREIELKAYEQLLFLAAHIGCVDLVDVEMFWDDLDVERLVKTLHNCGVKVVGSNHDFTGTPEKEELVRRLCRMQELDADIPKIAVMPTKKADVITLLSATEEMTSKYADRPVITISMGADGVISRICGEIFGTAVTFGAVGNASAPGQMNAAELKEILRLLHQSR